MEQEIRFCTAADGVRIAYATSGSGPPLVKVVNYLTHLQHDWNGPVWRYWLRDLAQHHTLVAMWNIQSFYRAFSLVNGGRAIERDLFAGLRYG